LPVTARWRANKEEIKPMFLSLYVTQRVFLLLAARKPSVNRGVIDVAAWLNIAYAAVMTVVAILPFIEHATRRSESLGVAT
jgi:hypothetical protein